jgi:rubrerythrin/predicted phosphodiesterase
MEHITTESNQIKRIHSFTFIGDPGCDGLGTEIMSIFNAALHNARGDFILVGGDIVPNGSKRFYTAVSEMIAKVTTKPIYLLRGNHDKEDYEAFFGKKNYFLYDDRLLLIVLDNAERVFSAEALAVLERALRDYERDTIILSFHIPPPNSVIKNSVSREEWEKVLRLLEGRKHKVRYILCGHIHSYFEDTVDGMELIASGGGGARMEQVEGVDTPYYHVVEFYFNEQGRLLYEKKDINPQIARPNLPGGVKALLSAAFTNECQAHIRYRIYAEAALKQNRPGLARLFMAASDSELYHARNHYFTMNELKELKDAVAESIQNESFEVNSLYTADRDTAKEQGCALAAYAFEDAREAEKVHLRLFQAAADLLKAAEDIPEAAYYTCTSCGYTFKEGEPHKFCPVCGAPEDKIKKVEV